jgi:hypothetical protein
MNRADRRATEKVCRKEGHLFKSEIAYCVRCGAKKP